MEPTTYEMAREEVWTIRIVTCLALLFVIGVVAAHLRDPEEMPAGPSAFLIVLFGGGLLLGIGPSLWPESYSVEISDAGIRSPASGKWVPWSRVVRLRERRFLKRVELIGPDGPTGITLEYQLDDFISALEAVVERVRIDVPPPPLVLRPSPFSPRKVIEYVGGIALIALFVWLQYTEGGWLALVGIVILGALVVFERRSEISRVRIDEEHLSVRRGRRASRYPFSSIESVRLAIPRFGAGKSDLCVLVQTRDGPVQIGVPGIDPFVLFAAVRAAIARRTKPGADQATAR